MTIRTAAPSRFTRPPWAAADQVILPDTISTTSPFMTTLSTATPVTGSILPPLILHRGRLKSTTTSSPTRAWDRRRREEIQATIVASTLLTSPITDLWAV